MKLKKILIIEYSIIAVLVLFNLHLLRDPIYNKLKQWKLVPLPETFTELYFTDHLHLPVTITANQTQNFKFTIHNLEGMITSYNWVVYAIQDESFVSKESSQSSNLLENKQTNESTKSMEDTEQQAPEIKILLQSGKLNILDGDLKNIDVSFKMDKVSPRQKIVVELADMDQTIHYWVTGK